MTDIRALGSREIYRSPWLRLREDKVEFPDGATGTWGVVERADFVTVLAHENDGLWLVEQYRYPLGRRCWEAPQGAWPSGHSGSAAELAVAELAEETGLSAGCWEHLGRLASMPAMSAQHFDVYLASELTPGVPRREATEADMVHRWFPLTEVHAMIRRGELIDVHTIAALTLWTLGSTALPEPPA